jgi:predicted DNA-binding protein (UPF0251 family)
MIMQTENMDAVIGPVGLKHREIAEEMGVSRRTASLCVDCAIKKLQREHIANYKP